MSRHMKNFVGLLFLAMTLAACGPTGDNDFQPTAGLSCDPAPSAVRLTDYPALKYGDHSRMLVEITFKGNRDPEAMNQRAVESDAFAMCFAVFAAKTCRGAGNSGDTPNVWTQVAQGLGDNPSFENVEKARGLLGRMLPDDQQAAFVEKTRWWFDYFHYGRTKAEARAAGESMTSKRIIDTSLDVSEFDCMLTFGRWLEAQ